MLMEWNSLGCRDCVCALVHSAIVGNVKDFALRGYHRHAQFPTTEPCSVFTLDFPALNWVLTIMQIAIHFDLLQASFND